MTRPTFTAALSPGQLQALRWLCADAGLEIGRGTDPTMGSIKQMLELVASGDALVLFAGPSSYEADIMQQLRDAMHRADYVRKLKE